MLHFVVLETGTNILEESSDSTLKVGPSKHCTCIPPDYMVLYARLIQ